MRLGSRWLVVALAIALVGTTSRALADDVIGTTTRVNVTSAESYPRWGYVGLRSAVTGGGRYIAFSTDQPLDPRDGVGMDVYVRDTLVGTTERISVRTDGAALTGSQLLSMSLDGDRIVFAVGDGSPYRIFARVRSSATTSLLARGACGEHGQPDAAVSANGEWLAFVRCGAPATMVLRPLTIGDDVVVASLAHYEGWAEPSVADTGVLVFSSSDRLVAEDTDGGWDAYRFEPVSATLSLAIPLDPASHTDNGAIILTPDASVFVFYSDGAFWRWAGGPGAPTYVGNAFGNEWMPTVTAAMSSDGRFVTWMTSFSGSDPGTGVFLFDAQTSSTDRIDVDDFGRTDPEAISAYPAIDPDGRYVSFVSDASLVGGDFGHTFDVFLRDREGVPTASALPDMMVRHHRRERWIGGGEIVPPWAAKYGTQYSLAQAPGDADLLSVRVRNVSPFAGSVSVVGPRSSVGCAVRYFHEGVDVTRLVVGGRFLSAALAPGAVETLVMKIRDTAGGPVSRRLRLVVRAVDAPSWVDSLIVNAC